MIRKLVEEHRILVTCGTGGVGKTTLSATLALAAATLGKRAVVITIDPAKRLKTSLGIERLGDEPTDVTQAARNHGAVIPPGGSLCAIVPETRRTFEQLLDFLAPNASFKERVLKNPIFGLFARDFSGANEYMALQRLLSLCDDPRFDFIVLDTPPSRNAVAFLEAPQLLAQFFDEKLIRWLVLPANRFLSTGMTQVLGLLEKLTGSGFVHQLLDFASALMEVQERFLNHLKRARSLLSSPSLGFVLVAHPNADLWPDTKHLVNSLSESQMRLKAIFLNRSLLQWEIQPAERAWAQEHGVGEAFSLMEQLQSTESSAADRLERELNQLPGGAAIPRKRLAELARDVHGLSDLVKLCEQLLQGEQPS